MNKEHEKKHKQMEQKQQKESSWGSCGHNPKHKHQQGMPQKKADK